MAFVKEGINFHQGDVQFFSVDSIPASAKKVEKNFIAKSERSGHAHAACGNYELYEMENGEGFYMKVGEGGAALNHSPYALLTSSYWDKLDVTKHADHTPTFIPEGTYAIGIHRRKEQFSNRATNVRD